MNKGNVIDLNAYREKRAKKAGPAAMSDDLKNAIQLLIERLRALGSSKA